MRGVFEQRVGPSRRADPARFVWDYWHVPEQYSYFRTHARRFFELGLYRRFTSAICAWGYTNLGCERISEPWLSYYLDGCRQELHTDVPQGPWAFVYSLTRWERRRFRGGETMLMSDGALDYWRDFDPAHPREAGELLVRLPAEFNQLTVFDARVPHGVARVEGTHDPLESRVVVHGWFLPPSLSVRGALRRGDVESALAGVRAEWARSVKALGGVTGLTTWRVKVGPAGEVLDLRLLTNTLVRTEGRGDLAAAVTRLRSVLGAVELPASPGESVITLPLGAA